MIDLVRILAPCPHVTEQDPKVPQSESWQFIGHNSPVQSASSTVLLHSFPPCLGSTTTERVRVFVPLPQASSQPESRPSSIIRNQWDISCQSNVAADVAQGKACAKAAGCPHCACAPASLATTGRASEKASDTTQSTSHWSASGGQGSCSTRAGTRHQRSDCARSCDCVI